MRMPAASDKGSQPYRNAFRCFEPTVTVREARESKWLVWDCPNNISLPLGRRHEQPLSLTYGKVPGVWCRFPAISQPPKGQLYGWLPLSNAYGISSGATQHKSNNNAISFHCNTMHNLTTTAFLPLRSQMPPRRGADSSREPAIKCEMAWLLAFFLLFLPLRSMTLLGISFFYYINVRLKTSNINNSYDEQNL